MTVNVASAFSVNMKVALHSVLPAPELSPGTYTSSCLQLHHLALRELFTSDLTVDLHRLRK